MCLFPQQMSDNSALYCIGHNHEEAARLVRCISGCKTAAISAVENLSGTHHDAKSCMQSTEQCGLAPQQLGLGGKNSSQCASFNFEIHVSSFVTQRELPYPSGKVLHAVTFDEKINTIRTSLCYSIHTHLTKLSSLCNLEFMVQLSIPSSQLEKTCYLFVAFIC